MQLDVKRLRVWFLAAVMILIAVVAGFYMYSRIKVQRALKDVPRKLGVEVQQSTEGFSLSKSEGGRTLFTIKAAKATQFKQGGNAELDDVHIVVYGREGTRFDQIYGERFRYDPQTGDVAAEGEVHIDLEANVEGPARPDQAQPTESKNPIHFRTRDLVFNHKTGWAATDARVEFRIPQASGSAVGATYDARQNVLTLQSAFVLHTPGNHPSKVVAQHAVVTKEPRQAVLSSVKLEQEGRTFESDKVTIVFRPDNSVERILAQGDVHGSEKGSNALEFRAAAAEALMGKHAAESATLTGGVTVEGTGTSQLNAASDRVEIAFEHGRIDKVSAVGNARFAQRGRQGGNAEPVELTAEALDFYLGAGGRFQRAVTRGAARIVSQQAGAPAVITAGQFTATFDGRNRLQTVRGEPDARIVSPQPGGPERVSTSRAVEANFSPSGGLTAVLQEGDFRYSDGPQTAGAQRARYVAADQTLTLTGSPRVTDGQVTTTANTLRMNRRTGDAVAEGDVKTTYVSNQAQPDGAMLAAGDPIHVTARTMTARRAAGTARFTGGARLWQGANIVEAPVIEFNRERRSLVAAGPGGAAVKSVFVQQGKDGQLTPVTVTAARLTYADAERKARFEGGVTLRGADATTTADHVDVLLRTRGAQVEAQGPGQLDRVVAQGHVVIQQGARRAEGQQLVYVAAEQKFLLTGGPPVISDPQHGRITGDSLTFYTRDDRVVVGSGQATSRTVTQTTVNR